jgi:hypothetical protein
MSGTPRQQIDARTSFFTRRVSCGLTDHHVEILDGAQATRIGYGDLSSVRLFRHGTRRIVLDLTSANGTTTRLRLVPSFGSDEKVAGFKRSLVESVARVAPETPLLLGPSRWQWLAAWIDLVVSVASPDRRALGTPRRWPRRIAAAARRHCARQPLGGHADPAIRTPPGLPGQRGPGHIDAIRSDRT